MLNKHMAACLVATALVAAPAFAQTSTGPANSGAGGDRPAATGTGSATMGSPSMRPGTSTETGSAPLSTSSSSMGGTSASPPSGSAGSTTASSPASSTGNMSAQSGNFIQRQDMNQVLVSKLIGTDVVGGNNESIGDVNDVLIDQQGKTVGVLIGVGGFLGIGEKDVAVPISQLEFVTSDAANRNANAGSSGSTNTNTAGAAPSSSTTGGPSSASTAQVVRDNNGGNPQRIVLRMTKEQLQNAPRFAAMGENRDSAQTTGSTAGSGSTTGGTSGGTSGTATRP